MNLEKMKQLNQLASELKRHGFSDSNDDAFRMAEGITGQGSLQFDFDSTKKDSTLDMMEVKLLAERMIRKTIEENNLKIYQDFQKLINELNALKKSVSEFGTRSERVSVPAEPQVAPAGRDFIDEEPREQRTIPRQEPRPEARPRVKDSYNPADVAIDKIFYCGDK